MPKSFQTTSCDNCTHQSKSIFCNFNTTSLQWLSQNKTMNRYKKGDVMFFQGNPVFGVYFINKGKIKVSRISHDGRDTILRIAGPGDIVGHRSLFSEGRYAATATVIEEAEVCFFDKNYFLEIVKTNPELAILLLKKISNEMGTAEEKRVTIIHKSVEERLADVLLMLGETYGVDEDEHIRLNIKLTRDELASMIGTSSETVIRAMSLLKAENVIDQVGKVIYIVNKERLIELSGA